MDAKCLRVTGAASLGGEQTADNAFIFIYGSLMRGFDLHHYIAGATFVGTGSTRGMLVALGHYPGLIDGAGQVQGEIYRLDDAARLEALDDLEEYDPANPEGSDYLRMERDVVRTDGSTLRAWVYVYNRDTAGSAVVTSGDWRRYANER
jgi:gamma-glutamylcyclotransferase (GGCT)/AIG2-like uncharacterized protein YtfP